MHRLERPSLLSQGSDILLRGSDAGDNLRLRSRESSLFVSDLSLYEEDPQYAAFDMPKPADLGVDIT